MITISDIVRQIIKESPFLEEGISNGLINLSSLARKIKPRIEEKLYKKVKEGAIVMSLKRLSQKIKPKNSIKRIFRNSPDMIVRSNLTEVTFLNSDLMIEKQKTLLENFNAKKNYFLTITRGSFETTIITSDELKNKIKEIFKSEKIISEFHNLSSITIRLSKEATSTPGVFYFVLKALAWEGINIIEAVSTSTELTLILEEKDINASFLVLKDVFKNGAI